MNKPTILIVDDDSSILNIFARALQSRGYEPLTAASGEVGLALARHHQPDVILCDINMPGTDGKSVLEALRRDPELGTTQIVLMTGNPQALNPREGMEIGADDFLVKPFGAEELFRCLEARLKRARVHWRVEDRIIEHLRSDLRTTLPHEFFTPLAGIVGIANLLRGEWRDMDPAEMDELLEHLEDSAWRLERTVRNYLMILDLGNSRGDADAPGLLDPEQVVVIVREHAHDVAKRHQRVDDLQVDLEPCAIRVDEQQLGLIVQELAENAFAFSSAGQPVEVALKADLSLRVKDRGRGMNEAQLRQVRAFQQFERKQHEQQGLGLGLVLVQRLSERCGATFRLQSTAGEGTTASMAFRGPATDRD